MEMITIAKVDYLNVRRECDDRMDESVCVCLCKKVFTSLIICPQKIEKEK